MRILLTGGSGFIGTYLCRMMKEKGWQVIAPSSKEMNICYEREWNQYSERYDAVVHLAAKLMINGHSPAEYFDTNTLGTLNALEFCRVNKIPALVYAMTHSDTNLINDRAIYPVSSNCYGTGSWEHNAIPFIQSKVAAADMIEAYDRMGAVNGFIMRLSNIRGYGSNDTKYNSPFHRFIDKARKGEDIEVWGNPPKTKRDFVYIKDVCRAFIQVIERPWAMRGYYNIGSGRALTILDEVRDICDVFCPPGKRSKIIYREDIPEVRKASSLFDIQKAINELDWKPEYSYRQGLEDFKREQEEDECNH